MFTPVGIIMCIRQFQSCDLPAPINTTTISRAFMFQYCDVSAPIKVPVSVMWSVCTNQNTTTLMVCFRWSHCVSPALWSYCVFYSRQYRDETRYSGRGQDVRGLSTPHLQQPLIKAGKEGWLSKLLSCNANYCDVILGAQFECHPMLNFAMLRVTTLLSTVTANYHSWFGTSFFCTLKSQKFGHNHFLWNMTNMAKPPVWL